MNLIEELRLYERLLDEEIGSDEYAVYHDDVCAMYCVARRTYRRREKMIDRAGYTLEHSTQTHARARAERALMKALMTVRRLSAYEHVHQ